MHKYKHINISNDSLGYRNFFFFSNLTLSAMHLYLIKKAIIEPHKVFKEVGTSSWKKTNYKEVGNNTHTLCVTATNFLKMSLK